MKLHAMAGCLAVLLCVQVVRGQTEVPRVTIAELLSVGWETKPQSRESADQLYQHFLEQNPGNRQVLYAFALVKMQQGRYSDAAKLLEPYLATYKNDLAAWRAKAWISMLTKNYTASLAELDKLSQLLEEQANAAVKDEDDGRKRDEQQQEYIRFLGRMVGYLRGPRNGAVSVATLDAAQRKITARLDETHKPLFDEGLASVTDAFAVFATSKDDAQAQEVATAEKTKRETLENIEKEAVDIASRREQLKASSDKIQSESRAATDTYNKADAPLVSELTRLNAQAALLDRDLNNINTDIILLRRQADRERDPVLRDRLLRDISRLQLVASRIDSDYSAVQASANAVQGQRAALLARHQQTQAAFASALLRAEKEFKGLDTKLKRADAEKAQLKKPATGNTGKVIAMSKQAEALTTYEEFPLEQEKQRILDGLK